MEIRRSLCLIHRRTSRITTSNLVLRASLGLSFNLNGSCLIREEFFHWAEFSPRSRILFTLTLSNLGDSIPHLTWGDSPELNNSRFLHWISVKFCMVVLPHKANLNFWHDWVKITVTMMPTTKIRDLRHNDVIICVFD